MSGWWAAFRPVAGALALGLMGGVMFFVLGLPLPWMLGAMAATTIASLMGLRIEVPLSWRPPTIAVLGLLLGSGFTAEAAARMPAWLPSLAALPLYIVAIGALALAYLRKVSRLDPKTAYFCATPGGLGEMVILGDRMGGDLRTISLVHATRILLIVFIVPLAFRLLGHQPAGGPPAAEAGIEALDLAVLILCGLLGFWGARLLRLPAPGLVGPMILSALAHLFGLVQGAPPVFLVAAAQAVIGASVGCRFEGYPVPRVLAMMLVGLGLTFLMLLVTLLFGAAVGKATGLPLLLVTLAFVPGGLAEMSLIALALTDDPAYVATNHIVRIGLVVLLAPPLFALYRRLAGLPP